MTAEPQHDSAFVFPSSTDMAKFIEEIDAVIAEYASRTAMAPIVYRADGGRIEASQ